MYFNKELIQDELNFSDVSSHEIESRTDTGAPEIPEIALWRDAEEEPPLLDPFANASTIISKKRSVTAKKVAPKSDVNGAERPSDPLSPSPSGSNPADTSPSVVSNATGGATTTTSSTKEKKKGGSSKEKGGTATASTGGEASQDEKIAEAIKEAKKMNPKDLKDALKKRNLNTQGNKTELLARLLDAIRAGQI